MDKKTANATGKNSFLFTFIKQQTIAIKVENNDKQHPV
jgi:hypothetical protein